MEFVSGYRDEFLDFAALLFGWFRKFVAEKGTMGTSLEGRWRQLEGQIRRLPQDPALWVLHVLPNRSVGISLGQGAEPGPGPGLGASRLLGDEPPLRLRDLSPYVSFVSLEDGEEGEEEEDEEEDEKGSSGTEKAVPQEGGEPSPSSRESPQEAKPPAESEVTQQETSCVDGCREDRGEAEKVPEKRKGRRSGESPGWSCLVPCSDTFLNSSHVSQPTRSHRLITFMQICCPKFICHNVFFFFFNLNQHLSTVKNESPQRPCISRKIEVLGLERWFRG